MSNKSPLFQSSMELLSHAIEHFNGEKELDRKLVIIHLANSYELILKDIILDRGKSIYKNPKETITITEAQKIINTDLNITLPFQNKMELLIDERNGLQHRFGSPNRITTIFYMDVTYDCFKEMLKDIYDESIDDIMYEFLDENEIQAFKLREPSSETELDKLKRLNKIHSLGALLSAMSYYENLIKNFLDEFYIKKPVLLVAYTHRILNTQLGIVIPDDINRKLINARRLRNMAAHENKEISKKEVEDTIDAIIEFEKFLKSIDRNEVKKYISKNYECSDNVIIDACQ